MLFNVSSADLPDGGYAFGHTRSYPREFLGTEFDEPLQLLPLKRQRIPKLCARRMWSAAQNREECLDNGCRPIDNLTSADRSTATVPWLSEE